MPQIVFLPHPELCPDGAAIEAPQGKRYSTLRLKMVLALRMPVKSRVHVLRAT